MIVKVEICIQRATSRFKIITVTSLYCKHQNFISLHLKSLFQSQNDMKYELFHDTPVPCMYVCVPLKPVLLGNHLVRNAQSTQNNKFLQYFCNIPRKKGGIKLTLAYR